MRVQSHPAALDYRITRIETFSRLSLLIFFFFFFPTSFKDSNHLVSDSL